MLDTNASQPQEPLVIPEQPGAQKVLGHQRLTPQRRLCYGCWGCSGGKDGLAGGLCPGWLSAGASVPVPHLLRADATELSLIFYSCIFAFPVWSWYTYTKHRNSFIHPSPSFPLSPSLHHLVPFSLRNNYFPTSYVLPFIFLFNSLILWVFT